MCLLTEKLVAANITVLYGRFMGSKETNTLKKIQRAAISEFLDKGFKDASLRQIVKSAGVTTGAFYGYFSSKEALFASIVEPHAAKVMKMFMKAQLDFASLPEDEQPVNVCRGSEDCVKWMIDYMYQNPEPFKLLICSSAGTSYEHFVDNMVEIEVEATYRFIDVLKRQGRVVPELDHQLAHIIASSMFNGIFEVIIHDMPYARAVEYIAQLREFYMAGWHQLMGW